MAVTAKRRLETNTTRRFGSGREAYSIPDLTEIQTKSYARLLQYDAAHDKRKDDSVSNTRIVSRAISISSARPVIAPSSFSARTLSRSSKRLRRREVSPLHRVWSRFYGTCEECRTGRNSASDPGHTDLLFARDALRIAIATERSGREFYTRAARLTRDARGRKVFEDLASEEQGHLAKLESRYAELLQRDPKLESRPTFLFFKGAANGLFAEGAERLLKGVNDQQALLIGIRCERGSHRFFKKYGDRFEDSEGKQIFLEFADEEREHLDLLVREYKALVKRQGHARRPKRAGAASTRAAR